MHRTLTRVVAGAALAAAAIFGAASPALAHDELVGVDLTEGAEGTRFDLTLQFNNGVMAVGSELFATDADGTDLIDGAPTVSGRTVTQRLIAPDTEQAVLVKWHVVSSDGHPIQGVAEVLFAGSDSSVSIADPALLNDTAEAAPAPEQPEQSTPGAPVALWVSIAAALALLIGGGSYAAVRGKRGKNRDEQQAKGQN